MADVVGFSGGSTNEVTEHVGLLIGCSCAHDQIAMFLT